MKPVYLEFCGIKSFSEKAEIDFNQLLRGGIFGVFGDTGAGKSTILDCIGFALYGRINRIGKDGSQMSDILNYRSESGYVRFTFLSEWNGERAEYRIERSINQKGQQKAILYKKEGDSFVATDEGTQRVNEKIESEILGIGFDDFKKCIALPQGEFSEFLQSSRKERLELVSKLFSLDSYGYALTKRVNGRLAGAQSEADTAAGTLKAYQDVSEEKLQEKLGELQSLSMRYEQESVRAETERVRLAQYEKRLNGILALEKAKKARDILLLREEEMKEKRDSLDKLQTAKRICNLNEELEQAQKNQRESSWKAQRLQARKEELQIRFNALKADMVSANYDEAIAETERMSAVAEAAEQEAARLCEAEKRLKETIAEYKKTAERMKEYAGFDYASEKLLLAAELKSLPPEDNVVDFVDHHFKGALLQEEYARFAEELAALLRKYPQAAPDLQPLIDKYTSSGGARTVDLAALAEEFRRNSREKERIRSAENALEIKNTKYTALLAEEARLKEEGTKRRKEYEEQNAVLARAWANGTPQALKNKLAALRAEKQKKQNECEELSDKLFALGQELSSENALCSVYASTVKEKEKALQIALEEGGMSRVYEAKSLLKQYGDPVQLRKETDEYFQDLLRAKAEAERLQTEIKEGEDVSAEEYERKKSIFKAMEQDLKEIHAALAVTRSETERLTVRLREKTEIEKGLRETEHRLSLLEKLRELLIKDKFMEYIAVEYLQEIAANANNLLLRLTNGRYFLTYGEKNFEVGDNFNEGKARGAQTLSGGEIFLVSLSLALSLSESIQRNSLRPIEFFFLDEGFGTLDDELVDTVMDCLEKLKNENFSIGIISHVGELKNRLESKIIVEKANEERGSTLRVY